MENEARLSGGIWPIGKQTYKSAGRFLCESESPQGESAILKFIAKLGHLGTDQPDREVIIGPDLTNVKGVLPVWDWGQHEDWWVIAMPRAEMTLTDFLEQKGGYIQIDDAKAILLETALALNGVAEKIIHRDLKPQNILLWEGAWYIADFGSAKYAEAATDPDHSRKYMYTPSYAAPEQLNGNQSSRKTDVWALGCIMYHITAGTIPFEGKTPEDINEAHLQGSPNRPEMIPDRLWSLIVRCLHLQPEARPKLLEIIEVLSDKTPEISDVDDKLASLGVKIATKKAEEATLKEQEKRRQDRRIAHTYASKEEFEMICQMFKDRIMKSIGPDIIQTMPNGIWQFNADPAQLQINPWEQHITANLPQHDLPLDILASSRIMIRVDELGPERLGTRPVAMSRAHVLWYCDPYTEENYGWYETAFLKMQLNDRRIRLEKPTMLPVDNRLWNILRNHHNSQHIFLARPFYKLDANNIGEFVNRWLEWFVQAADRDLPLQHNPDPDAYRNVRWKNRSPSIWS